jgi:hypothetical protein
MVAWLVTLVPGIQEQVVTILNYRLSGKKVAKIVEQLYVDQRMDFADRLEYARTGKSSCPAKPASVDGVPYSEEVLCGSGDRFFWARKVDDLRVTTDEEGNERLTWNERKRPDLSEIRERFGPQASELSDDDIGLGPDDSADPIASTAKPGSKQAVLKHFGVFQADGDLEQQLAAHRAQREAAGE